MRRRLLLLAGLTGLPLAAAAGVRTRVVTMTRWVKVFGDLETRLFEAQLAGDAATLQALLADDFEQRGGAEPGRPLPRAEWLAGAARQWPADVEIEQMAVHDRGDTAIVSFLARPDGAAPRFVVDVWVRQGEAWRLSVRYAAAA